MLQNHKVTTQIRSECTGLRMPSTLLLTTTRLRHCLERNPSNIKHVVCAVSPHRHVPPAHPPADPPPPLFLKVCGSVGQKQRAEVWGVKNSLRIEICVFFILLLHSLLHLVLSIPVLFGYSHLLSDKEGTNVFMPCA